MFNKTVITSAYAMTIMKYDNNNVNVKEHIGPSRKRLSSGTKGGIPKNESPFLVASGLMFVTGGITYTLFTYYSRSVQSGSIQWGWLVCLFVCFRYQT